MKKNIAHLYAVESDNVITLQLPTHKREESPFGFYNESVDSGSSFSWIEDSSNVVSFYDHYSKKADIELNYLRTLVCQNQPALAKLRLRYLYYEDMRLLNAVIREHLNTSESVQSEYAVLTIRILQHMPMFFQISWIKQMSMRFPEQTWLIELLKEKTSETA